MTDLGLGWQVLGWTALHVLPWCLLAVLAAATVGVVVMLWRLVRG